MSFRLAFACVMASDSPATGAHRKGPREQFDDDAGLTRQHLLASIEVLQLEEIVVIRPARLALFQIPATATGGDACVEAAIIASRVLLDGGSQVSGCLKGNFPCGTTPNLALEVSVRSGTARPRRTVVVRFCYRAPDLSKSFVCVRLFVTTSNSQRLLLISSFETGRQRYAVLRTVGRDAAPYRFEVVR